jgi:aspartyl-tRNA(Asn)/glutamyl-tRNA(Gln) amidotransferase subunit C
MSKLTADDVLKLARLSRLKLTAAEVEKFRSELSEILDYVEKLDQVDISSVEPTYQVTGLKNVMRPDEVYGYGYETDDLLKNAPQVEKHMFKVKRVL